MARRRGLTNGGKPKRMAASDSTLAITDRLKRMNQAFLPSAPVHTQELLAGRQEQLFSLLEVTQTVGAHVARL